MNTRILALATLAAVPASGDVIEYERAADEWLEAVPCEEVRAFDEFYSGSDGRWTCLLPSGDLVATMEFDGGTVTVTARDEVGALECAVVGGGGLSDGRIGYGAASDLTPQNRSGM